MSNDHDDYYNEIAFLLEAEEMAERIEWEEQQEDPYRAVCDMYRGEGCLTAKQWGPLTDDEIPF